MGRTENESTVMANADGSTEQGRGIHKGGADMPQQAQQQERKQQSNPRNNQNAPQQNNSHQQQNNSQHNNSQNNSQQHQQQQPQQQQNNSQQHQQQNNSQQHQQNNSQHQQQPNNSQQHRHQQQNNSQQHQQQNNSQQHQQNNSQQHQQQQNNSQQKNNSQPHQQQNHQQQNKSQHNQSQSNNSQHNNSQPNNSQPNRSQQNQQHENNSQQHQQQHNSQQQNDSQQHQQQQNHSQQQHQQQQNHSQQQPQQQQNNSQQHQQQQNNSHQNQSQKPQQEQHNQQHNQQQNQQSSPQDQSQNGNQPQAPKRRRRRPKQAQVNQQQSQQSEGSQNQNQSDNNASQAASQQQGGQGQGQQQQSGQQRKPRSRNYRRKPQQPSSDNNGQQATEQDSNQQQDGQTVIHLQTNSQQQSAQSGQPRQARQLHPRQNRQNKAPQQSGQQAGGNQQNDAEGESKGAQQPAGSRNARQRRNQRRRQAKGNAQSSQTQQNDQDDDQVEHGEDDHCYCDEGEGVRHANRAGNGSGVGEGEGIRHGGQADQAAGVAAASSQMATNPETQQVKEEARQVLREVAKEMKLPEHLERIDNCRLRIKKGFVPNMRVEGQVFVNDVLMPMLIDEYESSGMQRQQGGFLPSVVQVANVASLPGIVGMSLAMPDVHAGYGFAIGNVAAMDMSDPEAVISPGGVGFDINCGVRLIRTNLKEKDIPRDKREALVQAMKRDVPVGVGNGGVRSFNRQELDEVLKNGMKYLVQQDLCWPEDLETVEEGGCMPLADPSAVSGRAKARGLGQAGSLGSGNHFLELQVVHEVPDQKGAQVMGLSEGQICIMIHSGSRGLGHQVCTDFLQIMDGAMARQGLKINDRQLACARIESKEGQDYLKAMSAAANFAFVNRSLMTYAVRKVFAEIMGKSERDLEMHVVYDVCHNMAKIEKDHMINGQKKQLLVHRKGATRAFGPHHPALPQKYQEIGQPVLVAGSMGTFSWVLLGTDEAMKQSFGSACHGAGRQLSRHKALRDITKDHVIQQMAEKDISLAVSKRNLVAEEASEAYKDVDAVVDSCHEAGIARKCVKLRPLGVLKG